MSSNSYLAIKEFLASWDVMNFIAAGASEDEYDMEAAEIINRWEPNMTTTQIGNMVYSVLVDYMGAPSKFLKKECQRVAFDLRDILERRD